LVSWSSTLSCGVKIIDDQHKALLNLTNDLFNHCIGDEEAEQAYFKKIITEAVEYTKNHFTTEEQLMQATKFPGYHEHKREHDLFIYTVVEQIKKFQKTQKVSLLEFTRFLKNWLLQHIAISDKLYFEYFKKVATRKTDGRLSITKDDLNRIIR
jgi:hemerythrin